MTQTYAERFPVLLWGDLVRGSEPILRRSLAGGEAHECMYAWVYLTDYLAVRKLRDLLPDLDEDLRRGFFPALGGDIWNSVDRSVVDPRFQVSTDAFEMIALAAALAATGDDANPRLVELGSTFFTSRTKFQIVDAVGRECWPDWPELSVDWIGIDNSRFMHDVARLLHGDDGFRLLSDTAELEANEWDGTSILFSRFVASYVFANGRSFAEYAARRFDAVVIEDPYATFDEDITLQNHGQKETFFSLSATLSAFLAEGFEFFVLNSYPDFPSGTAPCHVVKYAAVKPGVNAHRAFENMRCMGFTIDAEAKTDPSTIIDDLNRKVSDDDWSRVKKAKAASPVWGPTNTADNGTPLVKRAVKQLLRRTPHHAAVAEGWGNYELRGKIALDVIAQALVKEGKFDGR